jgi:hypothetical protein
VDDGGGVFISIVDILAGGSIKGCKVGCVGLKKTFLQTYKFIVVLCFHPRGVRLRRTEIIPVKPDPVSTGVGKVQVQLLLQQNSEENLTINCKK